MMMRQNNVGRDGLINGAPTPLREDGFIHRALAIAIIIAFCVSAILFPGGHASAHIIVTSTGHISGQLLDGS
ncbi:MAG TPA: hypothetical protein VII61_20310, partial [Ktedonobacteraceae bacterium]